MGKTFKKIIIGVCLSALLTLSIFCVFNRGKEVKAEPISLAVGGVVALIAAYCAAAGITFSATGDNNSLITNFSSMMEGYSNEGVSYQEIISNPSNYDTGDWIIGRENNLRYGMISKWFMSWLEDLPDWLLNTFPQLGITNVPAEIVGQSYMNTNQGEISLTPWYTQKPSNSNSYPTTQFPHSYTADHPLIIHFKGDKVSVLYWVNSQFIIRYNGIDENGNPVGGSKSWGGGTSNTFSVNPSDGKLYMQGFATSLVNHMIGLDSTWEYDGLYEGITGVLDPDYQDYQDAIHEGMNDVATSPDSVGVIDVGQGVGVQEGVLTQEQVTEQILAKILSGELTGEFVGGYENESEAEEENDSEKPYPESHFTQNIIVINGLEDFFPFCIPYDFGELVGFLDAEPEAPKFDFYINLGSVLGTHHIELDFAPFDSVARIFRVMIIIGFIIFLILNTRNRFIRS